MKKTSLSESNRAIAIVKKDNEIKLPLWYHLQASRNQIVVSTFENMIEVKPGEMKHIPIMIDIFYESDKQKAYFEEINHNIQYRLFVGEKSDNKMSILPTVEMYKLPNALERLPALELKSTQILMCDDVIISQISNYLEKTDNISDDYFSDYSSNNGIPYFFDVGLLFYRKDVFEKKGVDFAELGIASTPPWSWDEIIKIGNKINNNWIPFDFYTGSNDSILCFLLELIWSIIFTQESGQFKMTPIPKDINDDYYEKLTAIRFDFLNSLKINKESFKKNHHSKSLFWRHWYHSYKDMEEKHRYVDKQLEQSEIGIMNLPELKVQYKTRQGQVRIYSSNIKLVRQWYLGVLKGSLSVTNGFAFSRKLASDIENIYNSGVGIPSRQYVRKKKSMINDDIFSVVENIPQFHLLSQIKNFLLIRPELIRFATNYFSFNSDSRIETKEYIYEKTSELKRRLPL
jgi:hypothetical protein